MKLITKVAIVLRGDRVEKGTEVDLTENELAYYDMGDFSSVEGVSTAEVAPEPEVALADMNVAQLKEKAASLGLATSGSKADLFERITLHLEDN